MANSHWRFSVGKKKLKEKNSKYEVFFQGKEEGNGEGDRGGEQEEQRPEEEEEKEREEKRRHQSENTAFGFI